MDAGTPPPVPARLTPVPEPEPRPLCHVCGSIEFDRVDESHVRCRECGHRATFSRITMVANAHVSPQQRAQTEELMRLRDAEMLAAFRAASFRPYGLDARWSGLRWFGGRGESGGRIEHLGLAYGEDPSDRELPEVRIETRVGKAGDTDPARDVHLDAWLFARRQVELLWRETGVLRDDVRAATFPRDRGLSDPTLPWERHAIAVDGDQVEFAVLREGGFWVAQAIVGAALVAIQSRHWPVDTTGLRTEADFDRYADGTREMRRRSSR